MVHIVEAGCADLYLGTGLGCVESLAAELGAVFEIKGVYCQSDSGRIFEGAFESEGEGGVEGVCVEA